MAVCSNVKGLVYPELLTVKYFNRKTVLVIYKFVGVADDFTSSEEVKFRVSK